MNVRTYKKERKAEQGYGWVNVMTIKDGFNSAKLVERLFQFV